MSKTIRLTLDTGNAAFDDEGDGNFGEEVARIFAKAASQLANGMTEITLRDINGNKVGTVTCD